MFPVVNPKSSNSAVPPVMGSGFIWLLTCDGGVDGSYPGSVAPGMGPRFVTSPLDSTIPGRMVTGRISKLVKVPNWPVTPLRNVTEVIDRPVGFRATARAFKFIVGVVAT
jgi:hypothetical protein